MHLTRLFQNTRIFLGVFLSAPSLLVFALGLLTACSHTPQADRLLQTDTPLAATELTDVPFFPQKQYQCGPAALATVLQYRGIDIHPDDLVDQVYIPEKKGSLQIEMIAATRRQGLIAYPVERNLDALLRQVSAGHPVLVMQNLGYRWLPFWHYAVVVGFDINSNELILRSGETQRWQTRLPTFERTWARSQYWGLVIVPPDSLPADPVAARWLSAAHDLEQTGQFQAAETAYRTALTQWPDATEAGIALTNLLYQQRRYAEAEVIFADLIQHQPRQASLWNNRAYMLQGMQCHHAALQAAQCAAALSPADANIQSTLKDMQAHTRNQLADCPLLHCPAAH